MEAPDFSVVIPLFNKRDHVAATLRSVFAQTLPPREVLVVDNGSTDGGDQVVLDFDSPLLHMMAEPEPGPGPARNHGVMQARGSWIAFIDADDLWAPNHLETLAAVIAQQPQADLVGSGFCTVSEPAQPPPPADPAPIRAIDFYHGTDADRIWTSAVAVRRQVLLEAGGFAAIPAGEDTDLWIRLALTHHFAVSDALTVHYLRGNGGIMEREQARLDGSAPPPSPVFATIAALLRDPAGRSRHAALAAYSDGLRVRFARQLVYHGHTHAARDLLRGAAARRGSWWLWWTASQLPGGLLRPLTRLWRARRG